MLREFDKIIENGAERIMHMAEKDQQNFHRHQSRQLKYFGRGQIFGFIVALAGILLGSAVTLMGYPKVGIALFTLTLAPVIASLVGEFFLKQKE